MRDYSNVLDTKKAQNTKEGKCVSAHVRQSLDFTYGLSFRHQISADHITGGEHIAILVNLWSVFRHTRKIGKTV